VRHLVLCLVALIAACAPVTSTPPATTAGSPSSPLTAAPTASFAATESAAATPTVTVAPSTPEPTPLPQASFEVAPDVAVSPGVFPIMTTLRLKLATVDEQVINAARFGVERYLQSIDSFRNGESPALPITGPFLDAVSTALKESATPGVKRAFQIESLTVDRHVQKPWGTHAYVEVTVTLVDHAVNGNAPDQRETGKLRLTGDRMMVSDGWDFDNDRWFNGFGPLPLEQVRTGVADAVKHYLWFESWTTTTAPVAAFSFPESTFQRERKERVSAIDRRQVRSNLFEGVTATIEKFETIDGLWSGNATVRVNGTVVTTNAAGQTKRAPFERHVIAFVLGNWIPEVVDEQTSTGAWASGGELALDQVDVNRA